MKKIKVCMAFLLTIMLVLSSTIVSYAYDGEAASEIIEGSIIADEDDTVDLSGIKIDVYKMLDSMVYDSTVYTDSDGSFSFARPSEMVYIKADPNSLPTGYGANTHVDMIIPNKSTASIKIIRIDSFEHDFFLDPTCYITTKFYGKNGEVLNKVPDYNLIYDTQQVKEAFLSDGVVNLKCDFGDFSIEKQMPTDELSMFSKILWLYENNLITEEEEIKYLVINLNNNKINSHMDVPDAYNRIGIYLKSHEISDELKPYIDSIGRYNQVEIATYIFDNYYNNEIGEAVNESYCGDEFDDYPDSLDYYLIHFDSANAEEKPYYNRFGDKDEYFEYSEKTNKLYESGFAIIYGNPYNTKNTDKFKSLPELYEINPGTVEYMLRNYNHDGSSEIMNQHCWGKVGDADGDFEISISDATEIQKHLADLTTLEGANLKAADIGNKGAPSISDATMIQYYLASLVDKL